MEKLFNFLGLLFLVNIAVITLIGSIVYFEKDRLFSLGSAVMCSLTISVIIYGFIESINQPIKQ